MYNFLQVYLGVSWVFMALLMWADWQQNRDSSTVISLLGMVFYIIFWPVFWLHRLGRN